MSDVHGAAGRTTVETERVGHLLLSLALASMMDDVGAHSGAMYLLAPDEPVLEMAVMAGLPRSFAAPWERVGLSAPVPVSEAVRGQRLVWVSGEEQMARRYPRIAVVLPYPFALAALPVATRDTTYGAVFLTWPGSHPPELSERERDQLTSACDRLAKRLRRAEEEGRPVLPEPDLSAPSATMVAGTLGTVEAARMVARLPYGMCALDLHGRITFANAATAELLGIPVSGLLGTQLWVSVPWLNDPAYEDRYRAALMSQHVTSFVALRPPSDWLSFRLYPGTNGLSVRISRARAVAEAEHAARVEGPGRLVTIHHVLALASALTEAVSVQDVVDLVADEIVPAIGGQALVMYGSRGGRLHVLGHRGYADPHLVERFDGTPLTAPMPGAHALTTGVPAFFESRQQLEHLYPVRRDTPDGLNAWAYVPLIASGRPVGTWVLGYAEPHPFPADERAVLTSLSGLIAQALERALLYDAKHQLAHGLQQALLPHSLPSIPGIEAASRYLPATRGMDIGGDFFDLVLSHGRASAVIGDVQGHNVTAAGLMGQIRTAVRAYTTVGQGPQEVMSSTNRLLIDLGSELFASCLYLRLDPAHGTAVMARAGHPPPLLRRPDGKVRVLDLAGGPLLGIDAAAAYPTTEVALAEGSVLVLYTDGLIESPGVDIEDALASLGERLSTAGERPLEWLADRLVQETEAAQERADDVALLLLRATGTAG
ncbi:SpoIIE family protein phosphatase [Streptomyces scabiei]|uniref:SpoIIE family protein phosphatase n=1 Tax=Streptomyces scabiei TaxID=1930 RepID=UPI001B32A485|nr:MULTISPECIES: SpoIIE family protein phosphatase [Streptomyces]MBP5889496.1 SpoIIE family protein phosphatase [Streptomyces sp. LBUM 1481]MBP5919521.1 SpoIIE family protein phosphatase [Streptomyces sp. LBUM 1483]MDX2689024.1 SpoIIE family protein phosphatase [Streptomyces scabiei]MDX2754189.1 SpoIIE family protein phosphatase [Streptomyces scabiei]MDX2808343.1 SpoIIE family protein phosphatase [Streptomyces scabiei]